MKNNQNLKQYRPNIYHRNWEYHKVFNMYFFCVCDVIKDRVCRFGGSLSRFGISP